MNYSLRGVTTSLPTCDRVEVYRIAPDEGDKTRPAPPAENGEFALAYDEDAWPIYGRQVLTGADAEEFAALWRSQSFGVDYSKLCHEPGFGLRFYADEELVFEATVCFECSNFRVEPGWAGSFPGFDTTTPESRKLLQRLVELVP